MTRRVEQFLLLVDDRIVRVALQDEGEATATSVLLVGGEQPSIGLLPLTVEESRAEEGEPEGPPAEDPPAPEFPVFPWFPTSLMRSLAAEQRTLPFTELHVDTSALPSGRIAFALDRFIEGVRAALAEEVEQPVQLTREEAERWGAFLFAVAES